jgi:hypothetical protein
MNSAISLVEQERERKIDVISETDSYHGNPEKEVSVSRPTRVEG